MIELRLGHVSAQYPAPASIIEQLVNLFPHAATETDSTSAAIRRMAQQASATVDQVARNARYAELAQLLFDDALVVPLHWTTGDALWLVRNGFTGFDDPAYGGSRFAGVHTVAR